MNTKQMTEALKRINEKRKLEEKVNFKPLKDKTVQDIINDGFDPVTAQSLYDSEHNLNMIPTTWDELFREIHSLKE